MSAGSSNRLSVTPPYWAPPRGGLGVSLTALGLKVRQYLEALDSTPRRAPVDGGPHKPPEDDHAATDSIWDDPAFWMMFMH
jgi:hypothetical protein